MFLQIGSRMYFFASKNVLQIWVGSIIFAGLRYIFFFRQQEYTMNGKVRKTENHNEYSWTIHNIICNAKCNNKLLGSWTCTCILYSLGFRRSQPVCCWKARSFSNLVMRTACCVSSIWNARYLQSSFLFPRSFSFISAPPS